MDPALAPLEAVVVAAVAGVAGEVEAVALRPAVAGELELLAPAAGSALVLVRARVLAPPAPGCRQRYS